jgi:hypothetical protein
MGKIESKFMYEGDSYEKVFDGKSASAYMAEHERTLLVTDKQSNVLFKVDARTGQNEGFLELMEVNNY